MNKLIVTVILLFTGLVRAEVISIPNPNSGWFYDKADTQTVYYPSANPKALLIFLPGGQGTYNVKPDQTPGDGFWVMLSNFRKQVTKNQIDIVMMDSPYAMPDWNQRLKADHQGRIISVVNYYKVKTGLPIYIIGHSNGAVSLAEFLNNGSNQRLISGAIFSGSANYVSTVDSPRVPVLVMHHSEDSCSLSTPSHAESYYQDVKANNTRKTQLALIQGGDETDNPCRGRYSHHMYWGAYDQVSTTLEEFILN